MRISDWSSDVCSSDLNQRPRSRRASPGQAASSWPPSEAELLTEVSSHLAGRSDAVAALEQVGHVEQRGAFGQLRAPPGEVHPPARKDVGEGKSGSVRVDLVGRRINQKKKKNIR